jgi:hypothetical protein
MSRSDFSGVIEGERLLMVQRHNTVTHALVYERARTRPLMRPPARPFTSSSPSTSYSASTLRPSGALRRLPST